MELKILQRESNRKLQSELNKMMMLTSNNNLYIKDITQKFEKVNELVLADEDKPILDIKQIDNVVKAKYRLVMTIDMEQFEFKKESRQMNTPDYSRLH